MVVAADLGTFPRRLGQKTRAERRRLEGRGGIARLAVYDASGASVRTIVNGRPPTGESALS